MMLSIDVTKKPPKHSRSGRIGIPYAAILTAFEPAVREGKTAENVTENKQKGSPHVSNEQNTKTGIVIFPE